MQQFYSIADPHEGRATVVRYCILNIAPFKYFKFKIFVNLWELFHGLFDTHYTHQNHNHWEKNYLNFVVWSSFKSCFLQQDRTDECNYCVQKAQHNCANCGKVEFRDRLLIILSFQLVLHPPAGSQPYWSASSRWSQAGLLGVRLPLPFLSASIIQEEKGSPNFVRVDLLEFVNCSDQYVDL